MATTTFDRPHVQPESTLHMFKSTSRLQCVIPSSPLEASSSLVSSSITPVINMDMRNSTPESPVPLLAPPPSPTDSNQSNIDHITSLEHSLCSDFVCCGARLPDLHALLEHFEEDHIMVLAPNGKRVYPPEGLRAVPLHPLPTSLRTTPSSSRSSSVLSSPNSPSCPLSPSSSSSSSGSSSLSDLPLRLHGTFERRKSSIVVAPVYTPFTPSLPLDPAYPYPDSTEIDMPLYDFSQDFYPNYSVQLPTPHFDNDDEDMSDATSATGHPTSPIPTYIYGPDKSHPIAQIPKTGRGQHATGKHATLDGLKSALRMSNHSPLKQSKLKNRPTNPSSSSSARRREKAFRCPTPRCTKSYLNPNGLKYHLEKGTCKIETEDESEAGEESNLSPSEPITTCPDSASSPSPSTRSLLASPNRPKNQQQPHSSVQAQVGSCSYQQPHTYQQGVRRHESDDQDQLSSDSEASLVAAAADSPEYPRQTYHQQYHQQYQYPYQYPLPIRPLYPSQTTTSLYSPVTASSHDQ